MASGNINNISSPPGSWNVIELIGTTDGNTYKRKIKVNSTTIRFPVIILYGNQANDGCRMILASFKTGSLSVPSDVTNVSYNNSTHELSISEGGNAWFQPCILYPNKRLEVEE